MRHRNLLLPLFLLAACGDDTVAPAATVVDVAVRDSVGVSVWEYSEAAWQAAPQWELSAQPLAVIGGSDDETAVDLSSGLVGASSGSVGLLLPNGDIVVVAGQPAEIVLVDSSGAKIRTIGRQGAGPGEYRMVSQMLIVGDTLLAFDPMQRKAVLFGLDGSSRGEREYPTISPLPVPPTILGTLTDGTSIHRVDGLTAEAPAGANPESYQIPLAIVSLVSGGASYDTLFMVKGVEMYSSSITFEGNSTAIPRQIGFGVTPLLTVAPDALWFTPADRFELHRRSTGGALLQIVRVALPAREVTAADEAEYKNAFGAALRRLGALVPPALLDGEIKQLDKTRFARHFPAFAQLVVDPTGALWANLGGSLLDSTTSWGVFDSDGALQGRVTLPKGMLFAAGTDRVVIRREDPETGSIRLEVLGITRSR